MSEETFHSKSSLKRFQATQPKPPIDEWDDETTMKVESPKDKLTSSQPMTTEEATEASTTLQPSFFHIPKEPSPTNISPEEAANVILTYLPPNLKLLAEEVADVVLKIPRWHLVAGLVLAMAESGQMTIPSIDPGWARDSFRATEYTCEQCKGTFSPDHMGQRFCSSKCGNAWLKGHK